MPFSPSTKSSSNAVLMLILSSSSCSVQSAAGTTSCTSSAARWTSAGLALSVVPSGGFLPEPFLAVPPDAFFSCFASALPWLPDAIGRAVTLAVGRVAFSCLMS